MMISPSYAAGSPEIRLLLASAAWPQTEADRARIRDVFAGGVDRRVFLELVQHHRLAPLVSRNLQTGLAEDLRTQSDDLLESLRQLAEENGFRALRSLAELRRVSNRLGSAGVAVRVLKGIPLAKTIYGDLSLRSAGDLDLLIDEHRLAEADRILREDGYQGLFDLERFSPRQLAFYRAHWKDNAYRNPDSGAEIDLHWRCFRNRETPGAALCASGAEETVSFGSFQVKTLPRTENLLYLCMHGTLDGWVYLKSLADVAAAVRPMSGDELDRLAEAATRYSVLPEVSAALLLVHLYFGLESWSEGLLSECERTVAHILRFARRSLEQKAFVAGRQDIPAHSMVAFELGLRDSFAYRRELLVRILFRARMWQTIPLPDALFGLYPLLSPFEWIAFRLRGSRDERDLTQP